VSRVLFVRNRQRARAVDARLLRSTATALLREILGLDRFELGIHLVASSEMSSVNQTFLGHVGPTDVITFDYVETKPRSQRAPPGPPPFLHGEIFICVEEAIRQAKAFRTSWQKELARYLVHGVLHLCGFDDRRASARRRMKRKEDAALRKLGRRQNLSQLARRR
jgi:probable rRNA maturation factor